MIFIPTKWLPYMFIILGVVGTVVVSTKGEGADKVFGMAVCILAAVGGTVWAVIKATKRK